jgi:hypothetical protein
MSGETSASFSSVSLSELAECRSLLANSAIIAQNVSFLFHRRVVVHLPPRPPFRFGTNGVGRSGWFDPGAAIGFRPTPPSIVPSACLIRSLPDIALGCCGVLGFGSGGGLRAGFFAILASLTFSDLLIVTLKGGKGNKSDSTSNKHKKEKIEYYEVTDAITANRAYQLFEHHLLDAVGDLCEHASFDFAQEYAQETIEKLQRKLDQLQPEEEATEETETEAA